MVSQTPDERRSRLSPYIRAEHVSKSYETAAGPVRVLEDESFSLATGEIATVLGVSGTGKSTLLNLLGGIDRPSNGSIIVGEQRLEELSSEELTVYRQRTVGFIFQFYNLLPTLTALENVLSAIEAGGGVTEQHERNASDLLGAVGLEGKLDKFPEQLSGGEQQRVAVARALVKRPALILADEPTGNLDPKTGKRVLDLLVARARETQATVVIVTHNPDIAQVTDRTLSFDNGHLTER